MNEPVAEAVCIETGCTEVANTERPVTPDVVELVCQGHEAPSSE